MVGRRFLDLRTLCPPRPALKMLGSQSEDSPSLIVAPNGGLSCEPGRERAGRGGHSVLTSGKTATPTLKTLGACLCAATVLGRPEPESAQIW
jgi:hypothetical protein